MTVSDLAGRPCEACRAGAPQVTQQQLDELMAQLPEWRIIEVDGVKRLTRTFSCENFLDAMAFAECISEVAEQEHHHPSLLVEWGKLTVTWWTHKIKGLHENDFILAARTDLLSFSKK